MIFHMKSADMLVTLKVAVQRAAAFMRPPRDQALTLETVMTDARSADVVQQFHKLWYASEAAGHVRWMGQPVLKSPFDLWVYQQILVDCRPDVLIETGTHRGGSALYFSMIAGLAGLNMDVVTIDFNPKIAYDATAHRIHSIAGISTTSATFSKVKEFLQGRAAHGRLPSVMVVLDSDHSMDNVSKELEMYAPLVTPGQYLVVEDTNVNGHPVLPGHGPGPYEAVDAFLSTHRDLRRDANCERFLFTQNPGGWLKRH
jgi:cephalosporin hydroxylase